MFRCHSPKYETLSMNIRIQLNHSPSQVKIPTIKTAEIKNNNIPTERILPTRSRFFCSQENERFLKKETHLPPTSTQFKSIAFEIIEKIFPTAYSFSVVDLSLNCFAVNCIPT